MRPRLGMKTRIKISVGECVVGMWGGWVDVLVGVQDGGAGDNHPPRRIVVLGQGGPGGHFGARSRQPHENV